LPFDLKSAEHCGVLVVEFSSEATRIEPANNFSKPGLTRVPQISRVGAQPSRVLEQASPAGGQPCRISAHLFPANFTWVEVAAMTEAANNQLLGRGGFGPVYMGILPNNKQVAVKILDDASRQGDSEFLNEVT
jgi:hypothetical protein